MIFQSVPTRAFSSFGKSTPVEPGAVPPWFVYTIGGVLVSVVLMLAVLFVVVLKIRRR